MLPLVLARLYLGFSGDTHIDLTRERLQAPWRALAFREKALDSTPSARIVEHVSVVRYWCCTSWFHARVVVTGTVTVHM